MTASSALSVHIVSFNVKPEHGSFIEAQTQNVKTAE